MGLGEDWRLGRGRLKLLALGHKLEGRRVGRRRVVGGQGAEGFEGGWRGQVGGHLGEGRSGQVRGVFVGLRVGHLRDGRRGRGLDVRHRHGSGGQGLLASGLTSQGGGLGL